MIAAIYARKSTSQDDAEDETKSVNRQVENARVFATAKGWTVLDEHVYIDDGISGASTLTRLRAKARMLDAITSSKKPPFDVLICQAADRFSRRDGDESFTELKTISKAGVQVWFYSDGTCFRYGTFEANVSGFLKGEFAAEYRRAVSQKTTEAHRQKAQLGLARAGFLVGRVPHRTTMSGTRAPIGRSHTPFTCRDSQMPTSAALSRVPPNHATTSPLPVSTIVEACALANGAVSNTNSDAVTGETTGPGPRAVGPTTAAAQS